MKSGKLVISYDTIAFEIEGKPYQGSLYEFKETYNDNKCSYGIDLNPEDYMPIVESIRKEEEPVVRFTVAGVEYKGVVMLRSIRSFAYQGRLSSPTISLSKKQYETLTPLCNPEIERELSFTALM